MRTDLGSVFSLNAFACTVVEREHKSGSLVSCLHGESDWGWGGCAAFLEGYVYTILETAVTPFRMINL